MNRPLVDSIIHKVKSGDINEMQKFSDLYNADDQKFMDKDYEYSAYVLGECVAIHANKLVAEHGLLDKLLATRIAKTGDVIRYDKDPYTVAFTLGEKGDTLDVGYGRYVYPPEYEVSCLVRFPNETNGSIFYNKLLKETVERIINIQDTALIKLLNKAAAFRDSVSDNFVAALESVRFTIESGRLLADKIIFSGDTARQFVLKLVNEGKSHLMTPESNAKRVQAGYIGKYLQGSALICKSSEFDVEQVYDDIIYAVGESIYLGGAPVLVPLFAEPVNDGTSRGLFFYKLMSMVIINPYATAKCILTAYNLTSSQNLVQSSVGSCGSDCSAKEGNCGCDTSDSCKDSKCKSLYCECKDPDSKYVRIGREDVKVCKKCKKEVK